MDSGRFLLAVILMIAVMVVTNLLLPPERPPLVEAPAADTAAVPVTAPSDVPADTPGIAERTEAPAPATDAPAAALPVADATVPADTIVAASPRYEYRISTRGAAVVGARLLQYDVLHEDREGERVELSHEDLPGLFSYRLRVGTREIPLDGLTFATDVDTFAVT